jgi:hypothetical protein
MKKTILIFALIIAAASQTSFAQDSTKTQTSPLLGTYYKLKDALVSSNPIMAAEAATAFIVTLNSIGQNLIQDESRNALLSDASAIAQTKDLKVQRDKFAGLSNNMFILAKTVKLSTDPVYEQYCPMKKASWLSNNKAIKNPYYGNAMLTCGSVKETL